MNVNTERGIALMCDPNGTILDVIRDEFGITSEPAHGVPVTALASTGGSAKVTRFSGGRGAQTKWRSTGN